MPGAVAARVPWRIVGGLAVGNLLNPLNSSMIAVALVSLSADFGVPLATVTWVVSAFYLGGAVGMPLMGQLTDRYGARRVLTAGLVLVAVTSGLAPVVASLAMLIVLRLFQAVGTSAPYPATLAIFRARDAHGRAPAGALGARGAGPAAAEGSASSGGANGQAHRRSVPALTPFCVRALLRRAVTAWQRGAK